MRENSFQKLSERRQDSRLGSAFEITSKGVLILVMMMGSLTLARRARGEDSIPVDVLKAIKKATVYVKVKVEGEDCSGSGFVVMRDDGAAYVITNHHVIAPELAEIVAQWQSAPRTPSGPRNYRGRYGSRGIPYTPPLPYGPRDNAGPRLVPRLVIREGKNVEITVVFHSGTPDEQAVKAEIMAADPDIDLAILKVTGAKNIPRPIDCKPAVDCAETMPVYSFGFPFGDVLATNKGNPAVTVGKATISSLRNDDAGELAFVQIDGALNPGNSGGPVVDAQGRLVGVAVATIRNSSGIGLAIPGKKVPWMWEGHLGKPHVVLAPSADDVPLMIATVDVFDPFHKLKTVSLSFLSADRLTDKPKPADRLKELPGCHEIVLKVDGNIASGHFPLKKGLQQVRVLYQGESVDGEGQRRVTHSAEGLLRLPVQPGFNGPLQFAGPKPPPPYSSPKYKVTDPLTTTEGFTMVVDDLKSGDFSRLVQAEMRLIQATPEGRHPELASALEQVLGNDSNAVIRAHAAWALIKWGAAENIPALEKAARTDASPAVRSRATVTIDAIKLRK